jgi:hypothetical protein
LGIKRIIVESLNGICIVNQLLDRAYTEREVRVVFGRLKLPIFSLHIDLMGTALLVVGKNHWS